MKNPVYKLIYLIVPFLILGIAYYLRNVIGIYHTTGVDPEYAFLFNGLNIALLKLNIWHIQHPATPLQILAGIVIRIIHLFNGEGDIIKDVLNRPEQYLKIISYTIFLLIAAANALLGYYSDKLFKQPLISILLQLAPFVSTVVVGSFFRVALEPMLIITIQFYIIYLIYLLKSDIERTHIIIFAIITALSIATKVNTFSLAIIPLFFLRTNKDRILYLGATLIAFFIWAFPVIIRIRQYFFWIKELILHSGRYGSGEQKFIDWSAFLNSLKDMFTNEWLWTILLLIVLAGLIMMILPSTYQRFFHQDNKSKKMLLGIMISFILLFIIVGKHYAYYYLMPALLLITPALAIILLNLKSDYLRKGVAGIFIFSIFSVQLNGITQLLSIYKERNMERKNTVEFVNDSFKPDDNIILIPNYYGHAFPQYALYFGSWWSGPNEREKVYLTHLKLMYPNTFIYNPVEKYFHFWGERISLEEILETKEALCLSAGWHMEKTLNEVILMIDSVSADYVLEPIYKNEKSAEEIYKLKLLKASILP